MEIYFDRATRKLLRYVKWHPNKTLDELHHRFGDLANDFQFISLCKTDYMLCTRSDGTHTNYKDGPPWHFDGQERFWVSPKGRKLLEDHFDRIWQWSIPTIISVAALMVSCLK